MEPEGRPRAGQPAARLVPRRPAPRPAPAGEKRPVPAWGAQPGNRPAPELRNNYGPRRAPRRAERLRDAAASCVEGWGRCVAFGAAEPRLAVPVQPACGLSDSRRGGQACESLAAQGGRALPDIDPTPTRRWPQARYLAREAGSARSCAR